MALSVLQWIRSLLRTNQELPFSDVQHSSGKPNIPFSIDPLLADRMRGAIWGALVGDALGVPVEFDVRKLRDADPVKGMRSGGHWSQPRGTWSDDGGLLLASTYAFIDGIDLQKLSRAFQEWLGDNRWTARGDIFDVGNTTRRAISQLARGAAPEIAGPSTDDSNGNGSLMRILPLGLRLRNSTPDEILSQAARASALTHGHIRSRLACGFYSLVVQRLVNGEAPDAAVNSVVEYMSGEGKIPAPERSHFERLLCPGFANLPRSEIKSGGYVLHTLEASIWCLLNTDNFADAVLKAVNLGGDTDTTACVTGGIAGAAYGIQAIPSDWLHCLPHREDVDSLLREFIYPHRV